MATGTVVSATLPYEVKDPVRRFTPLGRPLRKPRRIATSISTVSSNADLDQFYFLEKPLLRPKIRTQSPSPCSYMIPQPSRCDRGGKINPRTKYDRDLLPKPNYDLWTINTRTLEKGPSPCCYTVSNSLGGKNPSMKASPAFSMRSRPNPPKKRKDEGFPAPNSYDAAKSSDYISRHFPSFTINNTSTTSSKRNKCTPGPAHYHPNHSFCQSKPPSFSFASHHPSTHNNPSSSSVTIIKFKK